MSPAGQRPAVAAGFTLLELIVVIMLLTILLGFVTPAFRGVGFVGSRDRVARELLYAVKKLKFEALSRQHIHKMHLDLDAGRIWVTREADGNAEGAVPPPQSEWALPEDVRIAEVRFPDHREVRSGTVVIAFYPQGYSDRAVIRLSDGDNTPTHVVVEAFLPMALVASEQNATAF
jgi:prepilin-type N-terminal cleavage/methylation domain-containing protein